MRSSFLMLAATFLLVANSYSQDDTSIGTQPMFGVKAGYSAAYLNVSVDSFSETEDISGFYIGVFADLYLSNSFNFQPELIYANYSEDGESSAILQLPLLIKYKPIAKLGILAGPQLDYLLNEEDAEVLKRLGFGLSVGASYDITQNIIIEARYTFGLSNRIDDIDEFGDFQGFDVDAKFDYLHIGLAYRF
jgi:opacity protein-like surface antigen